MSISNSCGRTYGAEVHEVEDDVTEIRVMLSELPPILARAARRALNTSGDMAFAGEMPADDVVKVLVHGDIDAVLLGAVEPATDDRGRKLLDLDPHLKVVYISPDGREAALHERRLQRTVIGAVSFTTLLSSVRQACGAERTG